MKVISPKSRFNFYWDLLLLQLLLYVTIEVPLRCSFLDVTSSRALLWTDASIDFVILLDILKRFNTGFYNDDFYSDINLNRTRIRRKYLRTWFLLDFASCLPTDFLLSPNDRYWHFFNNLKLLKLLRLFRLNHVVNYLKRSHQSNITTLIRQLSILVSVIFVIAHFTACFWFQLSDFSPISFEANNETLSRKSNGSWILKYYSDDDLLGGDSLFSLYITSLYWASSTLTTVGFGDVVPINSTERAFACAVACLGSFLTGYIISSTTAALGRAYKAKSAFREEVDKIYAYLRYREVTSDLSTRILQYYRNFLSRRTLFDEKMIVHNLSLPLRAELASFLFSDAMKKIPFFPSVNDPSFLARLMLYLLPVTIGPGDILFKENEVALELYFVIRGHLFSRQEKEPSEFVDIIEGGFVGEEVLNLNSSEKTIRRKSTVGVLEMSDLFSLSRKDYEEVLQEFPELLSSLSKAQNESNDAQQLACMKVKYDSLAEEHRNLLLYVQQSNRDLAKIVGMIKKKG